MKADRRRRSEWWAGAINLLMLNVIIWNGHNFITAYGLVVGFIIADLFIIGLWHLIFMPTQRRRRK